MSGDRCTPTWLHQTLSEALSPWQGRVPRNAAWSLCGLEIYPYPHTGLRKGMAARVAFASSGQARERGSTREPWTTLTVEVRKEAHALRSPSPLVTIAYDSIPAGMLGRGPHTLSTACRRRLPALARASLPLSAAPETWRSASKVVALVQKVCLRGAGVSCYRVPMIQSFRNVGTEDIFNGRRSRAARSTCPQSLWKVATRKLDQLDSVTALHELQVPPGNRLEALLKL